MDPFLLQVGSADHHIHYYDLRNISQPLHIFSGHRKAVSYVKFLSNNELASASTDSTLRLWDVNQNVPVSYYFNFFFQGIKLVSIYNWLQNHFSCVFLDMLKWEFLPAD